ncbi:MAG: cytochrome C biogenesis protein [Bacteroidales bacterium]|nr:cytochrome C biogenesis protein [Bacteroidales bacterium]
MDICENIILKNLNMKKILKYIVSMELAGVLLLLSAFAMGIATFIENDFGTAGAKALVYNSLWFEMLMGLIFISLTYNASKMRPWKTKKWSVFIFHMAFIMIILGAGITRYIGFEGMMSIREGHVSNTYFSNETYVMIQDSEGNLIDKKEVLFSSASSDEVSMSFEIDSEDYQIETFNFIPNAIEYIDETSDGHPMLEITTRTNGMFQSFSLSEGEHLNLKGYSIGFDASSKQDINISLIDHELKISAVDSVKFFDMMTGQVNMQHPDSSYQIILEKLYTIHDFSWVFKKYYPNGKLAVMSNTGSKGNGLDAIYFKINNESGVTKVENYVIGSSGYSAPKVFDLDGKEIYVAYGSETKEIPFSIMLRDFQLERYPASNSPSSYASEVTLIDESKNINMEYRIFMNHVLDHRGYRFFQSSYDPDEHGTVLSVNHDFWGMFVTYLGYALMSLGMFMALFTRNSRFRQLMRKTSAASILILGFILFNPTVSESQNTSSCVVDKIPDAEIEKLSRLLVQGHSGRFQPFNSISNQVVRKFSRRTSYEGLNCDKVLLGMMMNPEYWVQQPLIKVSHDEIKKIIGNDGSRARFVDFFEATPSGNRYKLEAYVNKAYQKKPAQRGKFDKDVITVDERVNVFYMGINSNFIKIFPVSSEPNSEWLSPQGPFNNFQSEDSAFISSVFSFYLQSLKAGQKNGNYDDADLMLQGISQFQESHSSHYLTHIEKMEQEISYNEINIFDRLYGVYGLVGFVMLILLFFKVLVPKYQLKWTIHIFASLIFLAFIAHTLGLIARWYIAGHAPWSNGFESMIFIGWATVLAGLIFYKNSPIALASTSVLTFLILYVAHLSWMNPEITNLVPVLKSYWLTIHVAIITASYGFLALGAFMGFINLLFLISISSGNVFRLKEKIGEISRINEMTLIVGLYLLTIGTFLGGVWANESWGRYWGWDPKETWAMVTIVVYAFIVHMRFIPGIRGAYAFNLMSVLGYFSVLMTYFGVNYYLSGLHSYASGDPMPIPDFVYYAIAVIFTVAVLAYWKFRKYWLVK